MTSPSKAAEYIICPTCGQKATRVGAQDRCDVYVCEFKKYYDEQDGVAPGWRDEPHITRILITAPRNEWKTE